MSGLKINFSKSEILLINGDDDKLQIYMDIFNCHAGEFPIRYLGFLSVLQNCTLRTGFPYKRKMRKKTLNLEGHLPVHS